jgi:hypothetical protein
VRNLSPDEDRKSPAATCRGGLRWRFDHHAGHHDHDQRRIQHHRLSTGNLWVSPSGSDSAAGTKAAPYATIAKALSTVKAGQTIVLRGGTYKPTASLKVITSGTSAKRITIGSYAGETAVIDGSKISSAD